MPGSKLYVGNLKYSVTNEEIQDLFSSHGVVKSINVIEGKGFGFVEFEDDAAAEAAREALDGQDFQGRTLRVNEAHPQKSGGGGGGGRGGGRRDGGGGGGRRDGGGGGGRGRRERRDDDSPPHRNKRF